MGVDLEAWKSPHIALSAITGQLADNHDILKLETKFIRAEHQIDDAKLVKQGSKKRSTGFVYRAYWFVVCALSVGLVCETIAEISMVAGIYRRNAHIAGVVNRLNPLLRLSYALNLAQYLLLVV